MQSGTCNAGGVPYAPGNRLVYQVNLGAGAVSGGSVTFSTCGMTTADTTIAVGTGCPSTNTGFSCVGSNDDAGTGGHGGVTACGANAKASSVTVPVGASGTFYVQVGSPAGETILSGLKWAYAAPPASRTGTPAARTRSGTPSRTGTATATKTRKRKL